VALGARCSAAATTRTGELGRSVGLFDLQALSGPCRAVEAFRVSTRSSPLSHRFPLTYLYRWVYDITMRETRTIGGALWKLLSAVVRQYPRDMSLTAMSTLSTLEQGGPRRMTDLAVVEGITQPSMTALVGQLERLGLAERRRDPRDGRGVLVAITSAGRAYTRSHRRAGSEALASLIGHLPSTDAAALAAAAPAVLRLAHLANHDDAVSIDVGAEGASPAVTRSPRHRRREGVSKT
jgi:DNA-binding MarR family transcriptional regulator